MAFKTNGFLQLRRNHVTQCCTGRRERALDLWDVVVLSPAQVCEKCLQKKILITLNDCLMFHVYQESAINYAKDGNNCIFAEVVSCHNADLRSAEKLVS